jgi:hypothetical protein
MILFGIKQIKQINTKVNVWTKLGIWWKQRGYIKMQANNSYMKR